MNRNKLGIILTIILFLLTGILPKIVFPEINIGFIIVSLFSSLGIGFGIASLIKK